MQLLSGVLWHLGLLDMEPSKMAAIFIPVFSGVFVAVFLPIFLKKKRECEQSDD